MTLLNKSIWEFLLSYLTIDLIVYMDSEDRLDILDLHLFFVILWFYRSICSFLSFICEYGFFLCIIQPKGEDLDIKRDDLSRALMVCGAYLDFLEYFVLMPELICAIMLFHNVEFHDDFL